LREELLEPTRRTLARSDTGDLTKLTITDLEKRFLHAS
jgi:hypothetical protein